MCPLNCVYTYYSVMRKSKDKKHLRLKMVQRALEIGIKPTAREFKADKNTVKLWVHRWEENGYEGLEDVSRRPHHSPNARTKKDRARLKKLKEKYKRLGADQIKITENVPDIVRTMRKIWRE